MSAPHEIQQQLFNLLKKKLPAHVSLVDELADLLNISIDSAYRRIRGEKPITFYELKIICEHYHLSVDRLLKLKNNTVLFEAPGLDEPAKSFADYLKAVLDQLSSFDSYQHRRIFYLCKDIPFWYFFLFPEIAAFKVFFWSKTINHHSAFTHQPFSMDAFPFQECFSLGQAILKKHNEMQSVELWNLESIHSTINQLSYYRDAGIFKTQDDFDKVIASFCRLIDHLQLQAEKGLKCMPGVEHEPAGKIEFYVNELILGNNTILFQLDDTRTSMITYNILSYLICSDERFVNKTFDTYNTLLSRSALISSTGEKERNIFFNKLRSKVDALHV
ncbi:MAG: helix-turn-helix domain-containing protein [Agriterribacter sp.]